MEFEWEEAKNRSNRKKHGIDFNEAKLIFDGVILTLFDDSDHHGEVREVSFGLLKGLLVIAVVHTDRQLRIRIISARFATPKEREDYYGHLSKTT